VKKDLGASVRERLLNVAKAKGQDFNYVLARFALERLLYRLAQSEHADRFLLKGALLFSPQTKGVYPLAQRLLDLRPEVLVAQYQFPARRLQPVQLPSKLLRMMGCLCSEAEKRVDFELRGGRNLSLETSTNPMCGTRRGKFGKE
jgi:hypothetical protein